MPARRSELWRRLETVNVALTEARRLHNRAQTIAGMWRDVGHPGLCVGREGRAAHWQRQAADYLTEIRTLLRSRSELALAIAVKQAPHARTRGNATARMEKP